MKILYAVGLVIALGFQFFLINSGKNFPVYLLMLGISLFLLLMLFGTANPPEKPLLVDKRKKSKKDLPKQSPTLSYKDTYEINNKVLIFLAVVVCAFIAMITLRLFSKAPAYSTPLVLQFIFVGIGMAVFMFAPVKTLQKKNSKGNESQGTESLSTKEIVVLGVILLVALVLRVYKNSEAFAGVNTDEMLFFEKAASFMNGGAANTVFIGESDHQMGSPGYYILAFMFKVLGVSLSTMRLLPAIVTVVGILFFYLYIRLFVSWKAAVLAALFFATDHLNMHLSRWMHIFQFTSLFIWAGLYFLTLGYRKKKFIYPLFAGVVTGFSLYFYNANKFIPLVFAIYMVFEMFKEKEENGKIDFAKNISMMLIVVVSAAITAMPLFMYIISNSHTYLLHIKEVMPTAKNIIDNVGSYLQMFTVKGSQNAWLNFPGRPNLMLIPAAFFLIGLGIMLFKLRTRQYFAGLILIIVGLFPGIFSAYWAQASTQRVIISFYATYLIIAFGINIFLSLKGGKLEKFIVYGVSIIVLLMCLLELKVYFKDMLNDNDMKVAYSPIEFDVNKIANSAKSDADVYFSKYFFGGQMGHRPFVGEDMYFFKTKPAIMDTAINYPDGLLMFPLTGKDVLLIMESFAEKEFDFLKSRLPNTTMQVYKAQTKIPSWAMGEADIGALLPDAFNSEVEAVAFRIPAKDIAAWAGLKYYKINGKTEGASIVMDGTIKHTSDASSGEMKGGIRIFSTGEYIFKLEGFDNAEFWVNGKLLAQGTTVSKRIKLFEGISPVKIKVNTLTGKEKVYLKQDGALTFVPLAYGQLVNDLKETGLKGKYYLGSLTDEKAPKVLFREEITPMIYDKWFMNAVKGRKWENKMTVEWDGNIMLEKDGKYEFGVEKFGQDAEVYIDGAKVFSVVWRQEAGRVPVVVKPELKKGLHKLKVKINQYSLGLWTVFYMVTPNGEKIAPVPERMLSY